MSDETESRPAPPLPVLIDDYVAQRDALAGLRREVAAAAGREAQEIVAGARAEIERALLKAQRELLVLRAQVLAVGTDPADHEMLQALSDSVDTARQLLQHSRVELDPILTPALQDQSMARPDVFEAIAEPPPRSRGKRLVAGAAVLALVSIAALAGIARFREAEAAVTVPAHPIASAMALAGAPLVQPSEPMAAAEPVELVAEPAEQTTAPAPVRTAPVRTPPVRTAAVTAAIEERADEDAAVVSAGNGIIPPPPPGLDAIGPGADIELIRAAASHWFEAFLRGDATAMRAIGGGMPTVTDQRAAGARTPGSFALQLDTVTTQVVRGNALYTARMTQALGGASYVSFVSQLWAREGDGWRLVDVRIVDQAAVQPTR